MTRARRGRTGFTLIEVVGAVMIVGIWFLLLSTSALQGVAAEGRAQRLLEASLIADEALADAETQGLLGVPIEVDETTYGDLDFDGLPEYAVIVTTESYDPVGKFAPASPHDAGVPFVDPAASGAANDGPSSMQRIRIDVFLDADLDDPDTDPRPLASRTTFVIDPSALALLTVKAVDPGGPLETAQ